MNSQNHIQSPNSDLLTFGEDWCRTVLEKAKEEATKEGGEEVERSANSTSTGRSSVHDLPAPCQLRQLISILFYASLETEERVHPQISVIWLSSSSTEANRMIQFSEPKKINDENKRNNSGQLALPSQDLRKLSALCDSEEILLLVGPSGCNDGGLIAWGILDLRHPLTTEANSPGDLLELSTYPRALSVHFDRPGYLEVKWNGQFLVGFPDSDEPKLVGKELGLFEAVCDSSVSGIIGGISDLVHGSIQHRQVEDNSWTWKMLYEHAKIVIIESMMGHLVKRKTGGTFLFVSDESCDNESEYRRINIKPESGALIYQSRSMQYEIKRWIDDCRRKFNIKPESGTFMFQSPSQSIQTEIKRWIDNSRAKEHSIDHVFADGSVRYRLRMVADWLAKFASIDGSVVMFRDLRLLAFAAKTDVKQDKEQANGVGADKEDPIDDFMHDWLKSHGMRHNSAANWVAADSNRPCKPSLGRFALTVSQDGHANAIYWKDGKVHRSAVVYRRL